MMKTDLYDSGFAKLYLWTSKAKFTMGMFFVAYTLFYLFFCFLAQGPAAALGLFTAVQMLFASFFIGIAQQLILPVDKLSKPRCALWVLAGVAVTLVFSLGFGWFAHLPGWCLPVFLLLVTVGMVAMIASYYLELRRETKLLNRQLARFQSTQPTG